MKMKTLIYVSVMLMAILLGVWSESDSEPIGIFSIRPQVQYSSSDDENLYVPADDRKSGSWRRDTDSNKKDKCKYPKELKDSQLNCLLYPSRISCNHTCMFGHTLSDGITRQMECKYSENKWKPSSEFEKCKPFVDCGLTLGPGGKYKCSTHHMDKGSTCEISCAHFEDKQAVPKATYSCSLDGKWKPKLPFCSKAGSGMRLVQAPKGVKGK